MSKVSNHQVIQFWVSLSKIYVNSFWSSYTRLILEPLDLIMAAVDIKGTMKDFCCIACLASFKSSAASSQSPQSVCSICKKHCSVSDSTCQPSHHFHLIFILKAPFLYYLWKDAREVTLNEVVHKVCSVCSLEHSCSDNPKKCEHCSLTCREKSLVLLLEEDSKRVCSLACLEALKEVQKHYHDIHL